MSMTDNERVLEASRPARSRRVVGLITVLVLMSGSCSHEEQPRTKTAGPAASPSPSSVVVAPRDAPLTEVGAELSFGDTARVVHAPKPQQRTLLELRVEKAREGSVEDLSRFILDRYTRSATPYYVDVHVLNVGPDEAGGSAVPLWGVDGGNRLLPPATFAVTFPECPSKPLPKRFSPGEQLETCLVFLAPDNGILEAVSFRPDQRFDPIRWTGAIEPPRRS